MFEKKKRSASKEDTNLFLYYKKKKIKSAFKENTDKFLC